MNPRKQEQLAHALRAAIQEVLARGLADPRIRGLITVTEVKVTTDRRDATVYVSIFPEERADLAMHGLHDAEKHVRHEAGELIRTRVMPTLTFKRDDRPKKDAAVLRAINIAAGTLEAPESDPAGAPAAGAGPAPSARPHEPGPDAQGGEQSRAGWGRGGASSGQEHRA
jgi:ribosome-binding factor A